MRLVLKHNKDEILLIDNGSFSELNELYTFEISRSLLKSAPPMQEACIQLKELKLNYNNLKVLPFFYFDSCYELEILYIEGNDLKDFPDLSTIELTIEVMAWDNNKISGKWEISLPDTENYLLHML